MTGGGLDWGSLAQTLVAIGWRTFWQAGLVVIGLVIALRIWRRVPAGARVLLWWLVCLKFVIGLAWLQPIPLPLLTPAVERAAAIEASSPGSTRATTAPLVDSSPWTRWAPWTTWSASLLGVPWLEYGALALAGLWLTGLGIQACLLARQFRRARACRRRAQPVSGDARHQFEELCAQAGLRRAPELRASPDVDTPHVAGLWRPTVLIPEEALTSWSPAELAMTFGHELVHVRRKDLWHGLVPSVAARIFFFHPLARLAAREYALAREMTCDARTLALTGAAPADYAQLLLRFGVTSRVPTPVVGGASNTFHMLRRRIDMLQDLQPHSRRLPWRWCAAAIVVAAAALPFQLTARSTSNTPHENHVAVDQKIHDEIHTAGEPSDSWQHVNHVADPDLTVHVRNGKVEAAGQSAPEEARPRLQEMEVKIREMTEAAARQRQELEAQYRDAQKSYEQQILKLDLNEQVKKIQQQIEEAQRQREIEAQFRQRERLTLPSELDLGSRIRNLEAEVRRLADLLESVRNQLSDRR